MFKGLYEACKGFLVTNGPRFTGGSASPVGQGLPAETMYVQTTASGIIIWQKFGPGDTITDWRFYPASNVSFNPSGSTLTSTEAEAAIKEVSNRLDIVAYAERAENTTGLVNNTTTLAQYVILNATVPVTGAYVAHWDYTWSLNDTNQDFIAELRVNTSVIYDHVQEPKDAGGTGVTLPTFNGQGNGNTGTSQRYGYSKSKVVNLNAGANTVSLFFTASASNDRAAIYTGEVRLEKFNGVG